MTFEEAAAHALTLPGAEPSTSYRQPAVNANGNIILNAGNEPDTSFCLHLDLGLVEMLMAAMPETFWQSAHYAGYSAVLVRYDAPDAAPVRDMIARSHARALARKPPRPRTPR